MSSAFCWVGVACLWAIAALHASGFGRFTARMAESDAAPTLKAMFPILYATPSLYLFVLGVFGVLAIFAPGARRGVCLILAPAALAAGALALMMREWAPLAVMGAVGALFLAAAATARGRRSAA